MPGAWAKGASKAVVSSAQPAEGIGRQSGGGRNNRRSSEAGRGRGRGRGRNNYDGRGRGRANYDENHKSRRRSSHHEQNDSRQNTNKNNSGSNHQRIIIKNIQLLEATGIGSTPSQRRVERISARGLIFFRTQYLEAPAVDADGCHAFQPHECCHWLDDDRAQKINQSCMKVMELGDVSKNPNAKSKVKETAPPLEECKPLDVNEETRWKSKTMKSSSSSTDLLQSENEDGSKETAEMTALLILNKISWTTLDRLTVQLMDQTGLVEDAEARKEIIRLLIQKAQSETHFGPMYAQMCTIISKKLKQFKKELLSTCQGEFETDSTDRIALATKTEDGKPMDPEEIEYHSMLIRKQYVGHIKFLGELYLRDVVKLSVMTYCLDELLKDETNEENLECFSQLMSTMGEKLVGHSKKKNSKPFDWNRVIKLQNSSKISNRIRYMLQDLIELKDRGWVLRRKIETAKSIADLHKELAKEERNQRRGSSMGISTSQSNLKRSSSLAAALTVDDDGFMQVSRGSKQITQSTPTIGNLSSVPTKLNIVNTTGACMAKSLPEVSQDHSHKKSKSTMKSILKEYFVGGDTSDAVLSIDELIRIGEEGSIERGAKVWSSGILMVMEMKETEVMKLLTILESCVIEKDAIIQGLQDPLEFLSDIEIDAPLARSHLSSIIADLIKRSILSFDVFLCAPVHFQTEGKAARLAINVLKKNSNADPSDHEMGVVEQLLTADEKKTYTSAKIMFNAN